MRNVCMKLININFWFNQSIAYWCIQRSADGLIIEKSNRSHMPRFYKIPTLYLLLILHSLHRLSILAVDIGTPLPHASYVFAQWNYNLQTRQTPQISLRVFTVVQVGVTHWGAHNLKKELRRTEWENGRVMEFLHFCINKIVLSSVSAELPFHQCMKMYYKHAVIKLLKNALRVYFIN